MQQGYARDERGLTLMELIVVLAIIAIIGAILAPNFMTATDKARLKADIQSAGIIQTAIETYNAEQSTPIAVNANVQTSIIPTLTGSGYLSTAKAITTQTASAIWVYVAEGNNNVVKLDITTSSAKVRTDIFRSLTAEEQAVVIGGNP